MRRQVLLFIFCLALTQVAGQQFTYPVLPDSISDRQERIAYMASHFWSGQSLGDASNFQGPKLLLDFLYLLNLEEEARQDRDAKAFVALACKQRQTFGMVLAWLDRILYDSSSPHYSEALYLKLLDAVVASEADSLAKLLPEARIKMMRQNQVGKPANDFAYIDKDEERHRLYEIEAPFLLLVFNNPDCPLCRQAEEAISGNRLLQEMMSYGLLSILAITAETDYGEWQSHEYPQHWLAGFDSDSTIYANRLYDIQRLPCMYLLDKDKVVLIKEASYDRVKDFLEEVHEITRKG